MGVGKVTMKENILIHLIMRLSEIQALFLLGLVKENEKWLVPTPTFSLAKEALRSVGVWAGQSCAQPGTIARHGTVLARPLLACEMPPCAVHVSFCDLRFAAH